jgi:hypothetical protein
VLARPVGDTQVGVYIPPRDPCVSSHSDRAAMLGSTPIFSHHATSLPWRWTARWCPRHSGTTNSSLPCGQGPDFAQSAGDARLKGYGRKPDSGLRLGGVDGCSVTLGAWSSAAGDVAKAASLTWKPSASPRTPQRTAESPPARQNQRLPRKQLRRKNDNRGSRTIRWGP